MKYLPGIVKNVGEDQLDKQCIPNDSTLWAVGAYNNFLQKRRELVATRLNQLLGNEPV